MLNIEDVSNWETDFKRQISGTREKFWVMEPKTSQKFMFKRPKEGTGEAWAEKVAAEVGELLGFNMMDVHLAVRNNIYGIIAKKFTSGMEEFYEGGDLFPAIVEDFDRYKLDNYTFNHITKALSEFQLNKEFIAIPVFDALIGNQDRHCDNWGIIVTKSNFKLAPIYDNGASLGFHLEEERIRKMLKDMNMFKAFSNRSYSLIGLEDKEKPKYMKLLSVIHSQYPKEIDEAVTGLSVLNKDNIIRILDTIPAFIMNEI